MFTARSLSLIVCSVSYEMYFFHLDTVREQFCSTFRGHFISPLHIIMRFAKRRGEKSARELKTTNKK